MINCSQVLKTKSSVNWLKVVLNKKMKGYDVPGSLSDNQKFVYKISKGNTVYIGVSNDPYKRFHQHKATGSPDKIRNFVRGGAALTLLCGPVTEDEGFLFERKFIEYYKKKKKYKVLNSHTTYKPSTNRRPQWSSINLKTGKTYWQENRI